MNVALVRGKFLNKYEMQSFAPLIDRCRITAFGSMFPYHDSFAFPVEKLISPMDIPDFPYKMSILNRIFIDAHLLIGLERKLRGFDIVHTAETYYRYTQQCLNAKERGYVKKVVATVLENIPHNNEGIWGRKSYKTRFQKEIDHCIALTEKTKKALIIEGSDEQKITVIGHGIDINRFNPDPLHWVQLGNKLKHITVLYSGRIETYKGVYTLLEAAKLLITKGIHNIRFTYVGSGSQRKKIEKIVHKEGLHTHISFLDVPYDCMHAMYAKADIVVAPSISTPTYQEQYCTVLLEAQAMGIPMITTKSGGIVDNVGNTALFIRENDARDLADKIIELSVNPSLRVLMGKKARDRAEKIHDSNRIANRIYSVYEKVLTQ